MVETNKRHRSLMPDAMDTASDSTCSAARTSPHQPRKRKSRDTETDLPADLSPSPRRKRISLLTNTPKQRKDECKKLLRMSTHKLDELGDPEVCLRKSVLISNTIRKLRLETEAKPRLWHHSSSWMQDDDAWYWDCDYQDRGSKRSRSDSFSTESDLISSIFEDALQGASERLNSELRGGLENRLHDDEDEDDDLLGELDRLDDVTSSDDVVSTCPRKRRRCCQSVACGCHDAMNNNCCGDRTASGCRQCRCCHRASGTDPPVKDDVTSSESDFPEDSCSCSHREGSRHSVSSSCKRRKCSSSRDIHCCASAAHSMNSHSDSCGEVNTCGMSHGDPGSSPPSCDGGDLSLFPDQSSTSPFCCPSWDSLCNEDPDSDLPYLPSLSDNERQIMGDIDIVFNNLISVLTGS